MLRVGLRPLPGPLHERGTQAKLLQLEILRFIEGLHLACGGPKTLQVRAVLDPLDDLFREWAKASGEELPKHLP
jgi:hypothetical protein